MAEDVANAGSGLLEMAVCAEHGTAVMYRRVNGGCSHFREEVQGGGLDRFRFIQQYLCALRLRLLPPEQLPSPRCALCPRVLGRLHVCSDCVFVGCWESGHMQNHLHTCQHKFAVDVYDSRNVYCFHCRDYVYDTEFDAIYASELRKAFSSLSTMHATRIGLRLAPVQESQEQRQLFAQHSSAYSVQPVYWGLRGLVNLGNTCFMNCILQAFAHNPLLRNFFLANMHTRSECPRQGVHCLACEMDRLFAELFSGDQTPYIPAPILDTVWNFANYFAGYDQQDAHEFLITTLNGIHAHCSGESKDCKCLIHKTFGGVLRSDLMCPSCKHTSSCFDPFFDISVDIPKLPQGQSCTLQACLQSFTQLEKLQVDERFQCGKCHEYQESMKQFSIKILPVVICIHLKRFEQNCSPMVKKSKSTKVDTVVQFPEVLDMGPYTCSYVMSRRSGRAPPPCVEPYQLFAVVNHHGTMDNGHYTCFVRHPRAMWIKCDDSIISKSDSSEVLASEGYLLFYIRTRLVYSS